MISNELRPKNFMITAVAGTLRGAFSYWQYCRLSSNTRVSWVDALISSTAVKLQTIVVVVPLSLKRCSYIYSVPLQTTAFALATVSLYLFSAVINDSICFRTVSLLYSLSVAINNSHLLSQRYHFYIHSECRYKRQHLLSQRYYIHPVSL